MKTELQGEKVRFTPLHIENIYKHFAWNNDPELNMLDSEVPYMEETFGEFKRRFEEMLAHPAPDSQDFEVHVLDGTLIGVAEITHISEHNRHCTLSLTICDRDYWGKGYGRDAMWVLLDYCFDTLKMHSVLAEAFDYNDAWKRLVEGMGFTKDGTLREYLYRNGRYWDKHIYTILASEYRAA